MGSLHIRSLKGLPQIAVGDDLAQIIVDACAAQDPPVSLSGEHILVLAQKIVSKAEGATVQLSEITAGERAKQIAEQAQHTALPAQERRRDPRAIQVVLDQSVEILRQREGTLICRTRHGFVCANAGVDASNSPQAETLILLPQDPDHSARLIRARLRQLLRLPTAPGVLITDSFGRAWRQGQCDVAIGLAGLTPLDDWRGRTDAHSRTLTATLLAVADSIAAAADLARAKDSEEPAVLVEGLARFITGEDGPGAAALLRPLQEDLFR